MTSKNLVLGKETGNSLEVKLKMQKNEKVRSAKMTREQQMKHKQNMELPVNKFLNATNKEGEIKYPVADKLRRYFINNPDPVEMDMRKTNALLHQLRWSKKQALKYKLNYDSDKEIEMKDKMGEIMDKDDCYLAYISSNHNQYGVLSEIRQHLVNNLLGKCDGEMFTFDQFNDFVDKVAKIVNSLGFELFPDNVELIEPL